MFTFNLQTVCGRFFCLNELIIECYFSSVIDRFDENKRFLGTGGMKIYGEQSLVV